MFSSSYWPEKLPEEIKTFINKHKLSLVNTEGRFNGGADHVFYFLQKRMSIDVIACAYKNLENDARLDAAQRVELKELIKKLLYNGTYIVAEQPIEQPSPRLK